ncbi:MAG: hypothetical protein O2787_07995 [Cyanobacteria bacterium]|nr:hypothetical protein [Cyanobacteriota bacterium]
MADGTYLSNAITDVPPFWFNYQLGCWSLARERDCLGSTACKTDASGTAVDLLKALAEAGIPPPA